VPADVLPDAAVGDEVVVTSPFLHHQRHGIVVERIDDDARGRFHRVTFRPGPAAPPP